MGGVFDGAEDRLTLSDLVLFEMEEIMARPKAAAPALLHLFDRLEEQFDGSPSLLILDEAWLFLDSPIFAARIREWLKTLRKKNVAVVFATQSLADIATSSIAPALIESCSTRIYLPNERAFEPQQRQAYERFGLNETEIDLIATAQRKRHYYYASPKGRRLFELALGPVALAFCTASDPGARATIASLERQPHKHRSGAGSCAPASSAGCSTRSMRPNATPPLPHTAHWRLSDVPAHTDPSLPLDAGLTGHHVSAPASRPGTASVFDPTNLIQNALSAARALEQVRNQVLQITNQIRQLENDARNLTNLGRTFAPELMSQLDQLDQLINAARGLALKVNETRTALETLYTGDYRNTDIASRARSAAQQMDNARSALQSSLLLQAQATEQLRNDQRILSALADASASATGALSAQQATNEILSLQAQQAMRLQALLVAQSRAEALERARELEVFAQARAQHAHFFGGARTAHPEAPPWP
jgi:P-type conjugative transfer protein TrbJ